MIEIDTQTAEILLHAYRDIIDIDSRMACSDIAFRRHYRLLLHTPPVLDAVAALERAMENQYEKDA